MPARAAASRESAFAHHRNVPGLRQTCVGQHDIGVARRQPGGHRDRGITRDGDPAQRRRQRIQRERQHRSVALQEHPAPSAVDRRPEAAFAEIRQRIGQRFANGDPDHRNAGCKRDPVRQSQRGPDAGKAPRTHGHRHQIERCRPQLRRGQHRVRHHRQQRSVAASGVFLAQGNGLLIHDNGGRAPGQSGIQGQNPHWDSEKEGSPRRHKDAEKNRTALRAKRSSFSLCLGVFVVNLLLAFYRNAHAS